LTDAREKLEHWRRDYNHQRPHSALADPTPAEFAAGWNGGNDADRVRLETASRFPHSHLTTAAVINLKTDQSSSLLLETIT
jgi:hypothetical protein